MYMNNMVFVGPRKTHAQAVVALAVLPALAVDIEANVSPCCRAAALMQLQIPAHLEDAAAAALPATAVKMVGGMER